MLAIRYHRLRRGLTQQQLADLAGTNQPAVSDIERGLTSPNEQLLGRFAEALQVAPAFALLCPVAIREHLTVVADEPL